MSARVGMSVSEGKPAVETKRREAGLFLSLLLGRKRRQTRSTNSVCSLGMLVLLALRTGLQ